MHILLVGCTGFLGKSIIHRLLTNTTHILILAMRPKNGKSIEQRIQSILEECRLSVEYRERMRPINIKYTEERKIIIGNLCIGRRITESSLLA